MCSSDLTAGYGNIDVTSFAVDQFGGQFSLPLQADLVWTSDNYHDLHTAMAAKADGSPLDVVGLNKAIFAALKPGGVFVVVDHASAKGAGFAVAQTLHRADEDAAKAEILSAGFTLDGESNVLADAADDHTRKVFELHDTTEIGRAHV